jgi:hypothetical protein
MNKCSICHSTNKESVASSCDHIICASCLHKEIFYNYDYYMKTEKIDEEMELKCIICSKGNFLLTKKTIYEF